MCDSSIDLKTNSNGQCGGVIREWATPKSKVCIGIMAPVLCH